MSAQAYTNRRRILAEAAVLKVQYPKYIATKNNLTAAIDCNQNYSELVYKDNCVKCIYTKIILCETQDNTAFNAGRANDEFCDILIHNDNGNSYDGGNATTTCIS